MHALCASVAETCSRAVLCRQICSTHVRNANFKSVADYLACWPFDYVVLSSAGSLSKRLVGFDAVNNAFIPPITSSGSRRIRSLPFSLTVVGFDFDTAHLALWCCNPKLDRLCCAAACAGPVDSAI